MKEYTTQDRLSYLMKTQGLRQVDILEKCKPYCRKFGVKLGRNDLSQYVNGKNEPSQKKLTVLALALGVNEVWLMGYDVDPAPVQSDGLSPAEKDIITEYRKINAEGREQLIRYLEFLDSKYRETS